MLKSASIQSPIKFYPFPLLIYNDIYVETVRSGKYLFLDVVSPEAMLKIVRNLSSELGVDLTPQS